MMQSEELNYNSKLETEWASNNPQCKQIESCYNSLSKKCVCSEEPTRKNLNLNELSNKTDNALSNETTESLTEFIENKRKQETLEEFTKEILEDEFFTNISEYKKAERLIEIGAKWQQERSYSEEEVHNIIKSYKKNKPKVFFKVFYNEWFEQFKKK